MNDGTSYAVVVKVSRLAFETTSSNEGISDAMLGKGEQMGNASVLSPDSYNYTPITQHSQYNLLIYVNGWYS